MAKNKKKAQRHVIQMHNTMWNPNNMTVSLPASTVGLS